MMRPGKKLTRTGKAQYILYPQQSEARHPRRSQPSAAQAANLMRKAENLPGLFRRREFTAKVIDNARGLFCHRRVTWS